MCSAAAAKMPGKRGLGGTQENNHEDRYSRDIESGLKVKPKFKDAVELAMAKRTTHQLKEQLREGIDSSRYNKYRKSDDEVRLSDQQANRPLTLPRLKR